MMAKTAKPKAAKLQRPLFNMGGICLTPGALDAFEEAGEIPATYLRRHVRGD